MNHYFTDNQELVENRREITFRFLDCDYTLMSDDGVFSKEHLDTGTQALLKACSKQDMHNSKICDLGCGYGPIGVVLNNLFNDAEITGFDTNSRAVKLANINFDRYQVNGENIVNDGIIGNYDWIITNPPIRVGKQKMYSLFEEAYHSLNNDGALMFVIRKKHGAKSAQAHCMSLFGNCELLMKEKGFYTYISWRN